MRAAEQFRHAQEIKAFANACVESWGGPHKLSSEQTKWVEYAERVAEKLNPLSHGYPDPVNDRAFDPELIPMDGPYPESEELPLPYPLLEIERMLEKHRY